MQARDFQRAQAFAQGAFERVLPALFDVDAAPQTGHAFETVFGQPGLQFAVGLDALLQSLLRVQAGFESGFFGGFTHRQLLSHAACVVQQRHGVLQLMQARIGHFGGLLGLRQLVLQLNQAGLIGHRQRAVFGFLFVTAQVERARLFFNVPLLGGQHLDLLLHLHHTGTLFVGVFLCQAKRVFQVWQGHGLLFDLGGEQGGLFFSM